MCWEGIRATEDFFITPLMDFSREKNVGNTDSGLSPPLCC